MKKKLILLLSICMLLGMFIGIGSFASEEEPILEIRAKALELENAVYLSFAVPKEQTKGADVKLLVWTVPRQDGYFYGTQQAVLSSEEIAMVDDVECLIFTFRDLSAKQMTDTVYVKAYAAVETNSETVEYYSELEKYSILQYAYNKLGKTGEISSDENLLVLLPAMLEYGASAQVYFSYHTDRLANDRYYQIKVVDGTLVFDGSTHGLYLAGDTVTLTANGDQMDGKTFSHWENSAGENVGDTLNLTVEVGTANEVYTAVYGTPQPPESEKVVITVQNGCVENASSDGKYETQTEITLVPNSNTEADFAYWTNGEGEILSENARYTVTVGQTDTTYTAVYATAYSYFTFDNNGDGTCSILIYNSAECPTDVILPRHDPEGVTVSAIQTAGFQECSSLISITLSNSIETIGASAFQNCTSLKTVTFSPAIRSIGQKAFYKCGALTTLDRFEECGSLMTLEASVFAECAKLSHVDLPASITVIGNQAFSNCTKLANITLSPNTTTISTRAFYQCTSLASITIPVKVNKIEESAFAQCTKLTSVIFDNDSGWKVDSGVSIPAEDIRDMSYVASLLTSTSYYCGYVWTRG